MDIKRGQIYLADLGEGIGSEQKGFRPILVIQNYMGNRYSSTTIIACITTKKADKLLPTHCRISKDNINNLNQDSIVLLEQIRTIDKARLKKYIGELMSYDMNRIDKGLEKSLFNEV